MIFLKYKDCRTKNQYGSPMCYLLYNGLFNFCFLADARFLQRRLHLCLVLLAHFLVQGHFHVRCRSLECLRLECRHLLSLEHYLLQLLAAVEALLVKRLHVAAHRQRRHRLAALERLLSYLGHFLSYRHLGDLRELVERLRLDLRDVALESLDRYR